jgi:hypothetical protein
MKTIQRVAMVVVLLVAVAGAASGSGASRSQIAIHEQGKNNLTTSGAPLLGTFTIDLAGAPFGPKGTTRIFPSAGATTYVNGQTRIGVFATDTLTSPKGRIVLAITGTHIDVNGKLTPSGHFVGPAVEYGAWKVKSATGIYHGWKGGGVWASVGYGYVQPEAYSVEWDGYIIP